MMFHMLPGPTALWAHVFPGDVVVCPGCIAYRIEDFYSRTMNTRILTLIKHPTLVLARFDGVVGDPLAQNQWKHCTFVLWTRHGPLCTVAQVAP